MYRIRKYYKILFVWFIINCIWSYKVYNTNFEDMYNDCMTSLETETSRVDSLLTHIMENE